MTRQEYLLRAALAMIEHFGDDIPPHVATVIYDGTDCDAMCLAEDIRAELGIDEGEEADVFLPPEQPDPYPRGPADKQTVPLTTRADPEKEALKIAVKYARRRTVHPEAVEIYDKALNFGESN